MTNKEFFIAVISADLSAEITAKAETLLAGVEKKSAKASAKSSATKDANLVLAKAIAELINDMSVHAVSEIAELIKDGDNEELAGLSTSKISAVCKVGVENGIFSVVDGYKVGGKGRAVKGYAIADGYTI